MNKEIGERIKTVRKAKGLKQRDLAASLNIAMPDLSRIENGDILPSSQILLKLKELLNISIDFLFCGESSHEASTPIDDNDLRFLLKCCKENPQIKHAVLSYFFEYLEKMQNTAAKKFNPGECKND
ncbi:MAG: helix-turn-helix domain-containing protein [Acidobacteria bacterium]|jgi:transcriptional regulator with XRE-family HTH domain|nr:helix-turn-helix domain-containing protein [Acidobacteriota bacterium]